MPQDYKPIRNPEIKYTKLFINNEWINSASGKTFPTINPATLEKIADIEEADQADVDLAVDAAREAFRPGSTWRRLDASQRSMMMMRLADLMERDVAYLASLETVDNGKPFRDALMDVNAAIGFIRGLAHYAPTICGQTVPADGDFFCYTKVQPVGVVGAILPWNFPLVLLCNKLGHGLAAGCTMVIKPAEQTPLTALYTCSLLMEAGFPAGVVNMVPGFGPTAGSAIAHHPHIAKVTFTGSTDVGRLIMKASGESNLKKVTLELGGKSPNIIFADADLDLAVEMAHIGAFVNSGQCCIAGQRVFVHEDIYEEFVSRSLARAQKRRIGDPFDDANEAGPQVDKEQYQKILELMESGVTEGARLLCGGKALTGNGYFIESTIFTDVRDQMRIAKEEIFGPVQMIFKFKTLDEVIERANATAYGLAAGVFTKDLTTAMKCANLIEAGSIWVNTYFQIQAHAPFGGFKQSGIGREFSHEGIKEYCEIKTIYIGGTEGKSGTSLD
jgi:acyl-CoA reductase-like NAD-dependent aldehyde dehydrogenase